MNKTKQQVEQIFRQSDIFSDKDGNLYISSILEAIENIDINLIKLLSSNEDIKAKFFIKVDSMYILEQNRLIEFFTQKDYMQNGSYTAYTNRIGLIKKDNFIKKFDDVVLAFPYKDCILEGGQIKDDYKKQETFYNEILASYEIDRLFEPKVLTNVRKFAKDNIKKNQIIEENDNLIIKGNNLIALHSLKKKYAGKVKLIYIDPPYNTGNDSFKYNDNFNHSTWLTFMKNRLEVAKEFLSNDGIIFVQCDDNEQAYLKVLMDEIFGREKALINLIWDKGNAQNDAKGIQKNHEYIISYSINNQISLKDKKTITKKVLKDNKGYFYLGSNLTTGGEGGTLNNRPNLGYSIYINETNEFQACQDYDKEKAKTMNKIKDVYTDNKDLINKGFTRIIRPPKKKDLLGCWTWSIDKFNESKDYIYINKTGTVSQKIYLSKDQYSNIKNDKIDIITEIPPKSIIQVSSGLGSKLINNMFSHKKFSSPKPEELIKKIIEISTNKDDLILDFHLGSGTTCAVAHKMGRRYIGIEQMDYIEDIVVKRLQNVINGEQGGVSKIVNWKGGGTFVYAELKLINNYKDSQIGKLNKNMAYLPISEIEDEDYNISKDEINLNKAFYGIDDE